jgi:hypothetical protein
MGMGEGFILAHPFSEGIHDAVDCVLRDIVVVLGIFYPFVNSGND